MVKKVFLGAMFMLAPLTALFAQDVVGKWKLSDGSAIVEVYQDGGVYNGKIVWLKNPTEADGTPAVDDNNPDVKLRSRQLIGLNLLSDLKPNGEKYDGGTIYDPASGKTYKCSMFLEKGVLKVRGHVGPFHRTMDWIRVKE